MEHLEQSDDDLLPNEKSSLCKESGVSIIQLLLLYKCNTTPFL